MTEFDPDKILPVQVAAEEDPRSRAGREMREARRRLADRVEAAQKADKQQPERQPDSFDLRLAAARAAVAPLELIAYRFVAVEGGFVILPITQEDLTPKV